MAEEASAHPAVPEAPATASAEPLPPAPPTTIEPAGEESDDEGEFESTDGYESSQSVSTSISSSIYAHTFENGRRYHIFREGRYPIPNDDAEQNREDMKHAMMLEITQGKLVLAPIGEHPQNIIDLGTGTGIWCIDAGDRYPSASVLGLDLSPIQPVWVPPNVKFLVDDMEDTWLHTTPFDLVHMRAITPILKDPSKVLVSCYEHMKPGGWIELQEPHVNAFCDDGTMPDDYPVKVFYELLQKAFRGFGTDVHISTNLVPKLEAAGFVNIKEEIIKVPIGTWAKNKTLRLVGLYWRTAIMDLLPAMAGRPFLSLGMSKAEIEVFLASVRKALLDTKVHSYVNIHFVYGQKPM